MDFVEEDMSRKLPASERINHTLLTINYGAILGLLLPVLIGWAMLPTGIELAYTGFLSIAAAASAVGAGFCSLRDFAASKRLARTTSVPAAGLVAKLHWLHRQPSGREPDQGIRSSRWCAIPPSPTRWRRRSC
jgi:hypothetical protein